VGRKVTESSRNIFHRNGNGDWAICFEGTSNAITHVKGFPYIAFLLARPGVAINVQDLEEIVSGFKAAYTKGESVPFTTIESLEKLDDRLVGAKDELTIATRNNDLATIGVLQKEINWIEEEKNRCKGLGKRIRSESELETLRKRITKRINDGIEKIRKQNARFADYLHCHIDRGLILKYNTTESVDWITEA
jgi:hypothetical protein